MGCASHKPSFPLRSLVAICLLLSLGGCEDVTVATVEVETVVVAPAEVRLLPGEEVHFAATPLDSNGAALGGRSMAWSSNAPDVITIDADGRAAAGEPGSAQIRASTGDVDGFATVVVDPLPSLALSTAEVHFDVTTGGGAVEVDVVNEGGGEISGLEVEVEYGTPGAAGWLDWSLSSTSVPAVLSLVADPAELSPGSHLATVIIRGAGDTGGTATLQVTLEVDDAPPELVASPEAVGFATSEGEGAPAPQTVQVTNVGGGTVSDLVAEVRYDEGSGSGWLEATLQDEEPPTTLVLQVNPEGVEVGVHDAEVLLSSPSAPGVSAVVAVRFRFGEAPPQIVVGTELIQRSMEEGGSVPASVTVAVENAGAGTLGGLDGSLEWVSGTSDGWVEAILGASTAPTEVGFVFSDPGLLPGNHIARWVLSSPDAINSPVTIDLVLTVTARPVPENAEIRVEPDALPADGEAESTITVTLRDARGDLMSSGGDEVEIEATMGSLSSVSDLGNGRYRATLTAPTVAGSSTVTATLRGEPIADTATVTFVPGPPSTGTTEIQASPTRITADGSSTSTLSVRLFDAFGNAVAPDGHQVELATTMGTLSGVTVTEAGRFTATLTSTTTPEVAEITGTLNGDPISDRASVSFVIGAPDAGASEVAADPTSMTTDGSVEVTVRLFDASGNPIDSGGDAVFLESTLGEVDPPGGETGADGAFRSEFTSTDPGTAEITAYLGADATGEVIGTVTVEVTAGAPDAGESTVTAEPETMTTDESATVRVELRDAAGNALETTGEAIWVETTHGVVDPDGGTTEAGVFETTLTSTDPGTAEITAYLGADATGEVIGTVTVEVLVGALSAEGSTLVADPEEVEVGESSELTVQLRDAAGNPLALEGELIFLVADGGTLSATGGPTDENGSFVATLATDDEGSLSVTAFLGEDEAGEEIGTVILEVVESSGGAD